MAQKDAKIKFLEHELEEKEREIDALKSRRAEEVGGRDDRLLKLEAKVSELETTVNALVKEVLDQKTLIDKISRTTEKKTAPPKQVTRSGPPAGAEVYERRGGSSPTDRAAPPRQGEAAGEEEAMDLIMQNDGTLKKERRMKSDFIIASSGNVGSGRKPARPSGKILVADSSRRTRDKSAGDTEK